jgi:hypothetical protein
MDLSNLLFAPIVLFVVHPERIAAIATLFIVMLLVLRYGRGYWSCSLLWTAGFWAAFALWEWLLLKQEVNIRVDLFLIYPLLVGITIWGLWAGLRSRRNRETS